MGVQTFTVSISHSALAMHHVYFVSLLSGAASRQHSEIHVPSLSNIPQDASNQSGIIPPRSLHYRQHWHASLAIYYKCIVILRTYPRCPCTPPNKINTGQISLIPEGGGGYESLLPPTVVLWQPTPTTVKTEGEIGRYPTSHLNHWSRARKHARIVASLPS